MIVIHLHQVTPMEAAIAWMIWATARDAARTRKPPADPWTRWKS